MGEWSQVTDWEKIFTKGTSDKGLLAKIHKEHEKLNIRKQTTWLKYEPQTWSDNSAKETHRSHTDISKEAPRHPSSGKCKLKPGDTTIHLLEQTKSGTSTSTSNAGKDLE